SANAGAGWTFAAPRPNPIEIVNSGIVMASRSAALVELLAGQPVVPVLRIDRIEDAVPLARALASGGLRAIEITLRTPVALEAIRAVARDVPEAIVGAGTILNAAD